MAAIVNDPPSPITDLINENRILPIMPDKWKEMKDLFCCPICSNLFKGRIHQCLNGHSYCEDCRGTLFTCPVCRELISRTRNFVLEGILALCGFKCKYYKQGCKKHVTIAEHEEHSNVCGYKSLWCASIGFDQCQQGVRFAEYIPHLINHHNVRVESQNYFKNGNYVTRHSAVLTSRDKLIDAIINFDGKQFILQFKMMDDAKNKIETLPVMSWNKIVCCWWVSLFTAVDTDCNDYTCEISVRSKGKGKGVNCTLSWEGKVVPLRAKAADVAKVACMSTTIVNVLSRDLQAPDGTIFDYGVNYEVSTVISKIPALVPELCEGHETALDKTVIATVDQEAQTDDLLIDVNPPQPLRHQEVIQSIKQVVASLVQILDSCRNSDLTNSMWRSYHQNSESITLGLVLLFCFLRMLWCI